MADVDHSKALLGMTAEIVSAHVRHNAIAPRELPILIAQVYAALRSVAQPPPVATPAGPPVPRIEPERQAPAVSPRKSVFPDYIVCLEDGRKFKTLKRHLRSTYNMTPEQYRDKWELAPDYPMVAPNYAEHRSSLAKQLGLGRKPAGVTPEVAQAAPAAAPRVPVVEAVEPPRAARTDHTAASVFASFPRHVETTPELPVQDDAEHRKTRRKPFSKQLARTMRP